ncbi:hypothetical protein K501DRAFT_272089 [Backusella circina FSU 941]|nr:hypothetical protein K501DRAFT_272089 [Backusella circina FSU 941]
MASERQQLLQTNQALDEITNLFNNVDLPARPKELQLELTEYEEYLTQQYTSFAVSQTINNIKKNIIQNTRPYNNDLQAARLERTHQLNRLKKYQEELKQLELNINASVASLEQDKNTILASQQEAAKLDKEIERMEHKIQQVNSTCSYTLEYTADEAKHQITQATEAFASLVSAHDKVRDACSEKENKEKGLRKEVVKLEAKREIFAQDAQTASNSYRVADKSTEEKCQGYKKYTDIISRITAVEEMTESNGEVKVVYASPYNTQLIISLDDEENGSRIRSAKVTCSAKTKNGCISYCVLRVCGGDLLIGYVYSVVSYDVAYGTARTPILHLHHTYVLSQLYLTQRVAVHRRDSNNKATQQMGSIVSSQPKQQL